MHEAHVLPTSSWDDIYSRIYSTNVIKIEIGINTVVAGLVNEWSYVLLDLGRTNNVKLVKAIIINIFKFQVKSACAL